MPVQVIRATNESRRGLEILGAMEACAPDLDALMLWGIGRAGHSAHRDRAVHQGRPAILWDLGYSKGYYRVSLDHDHPWRLLDRAPETGRAFPATLREDAGDGKILVIGMGHKSKRYLNSYAWEQRKVSELKRRFPGVPIQVRPKPRSGDGAPSIEQEMKGARLVVCRHSNVAVDATIAGVPFECEDGAAYWLMGQPFTRENRQRFLNRLAWFQWRVDEAPQAWKFLEALCG
jgi:hypothetical protein